ncbi:MAG: hypothetical protein ABIH03_07855 [Pseudomonadota bacterium]
MKFLLPILALAVLSAPAFAQSLPAGHPPTNLKGKAAPEIALPQKAKVLSSIDASQYTYIEVTQNKKTVWLAGSTVKVKKGDVIRFDDGMVMKDFHSKTLNRTFPAVTFVNRVVVTNEKE